MMTDEVQVIYPPSEGATAAPLGEVLVIAAVFAIVLSVGIEIVRSIYHRIRKEEDR